MVFPKDIIEGLKSYTNVMRLVCFWKRDGGWGGGGLCVSLKKNPLFPLTFGESLLQPG